MADLAASLGYKITEDGKYKHAGRTLQLRYHGQTGDDQIKVDLTYMNRAPLLPIETVTCHLLRPTSSIRTLALSEIIAGKFAAYFNRVEFRDLYDLHKMHELLAAYVQPVDQVEFETLPLNGLEAAKDPRPNDYGERPHDDKDSERGADGTSAPRFPYT